jgi:hypothetical protein
VRGVQQVPQLVLAGLELGQLGGERLDAPPALLLAEGAGFEGVQVAIDRGFGLGDLAARSSCWCCWRRVAAWLRAALMARWNRSVS